MSEQQSSYRQIMKATSLFGGVQVFNILISILRSKFVAVLLGPSGMGIMGLLISTIGIISKLTNFGLETSTVKDIAVALGTGNTNRIGIVVKVIRRLVWITGIIGLIITAIFSSLLSQLTFGNRDYSLAFIWISATLLFNQLCSGQLVILQGLRKLNYLAKANLLGSIIGLIFVIPLYYFFGLDGIVPGIITTSLFSFLMSWYYANKVKIEKTNVTVTQTLAEGKNMLQVGFLISFSGFFSIVAAYLIRVFISRIDGVQQVGLYNAGFAIINTYVGLIFNAMATDYYPRLSSIAHDNYHCKRIINQQAEIALLILAPILIAFLLFIKWVIILLYSRQFIEVSDMVYWAALGMFFKATSWSIAFIFLAKGAGKYYFWNEVLTVTYQLGLNIGGYLLWGLNGLGISFTITYILYLSQVFIISKIKYAFNFDRNFIVIFITQFSLAVMVFLAIHYLNQPYQYFIGILLCILSSVFSILELEKRLGLLNILYLHLHK